MTGTILCRGYNQDASIRRFWSGKRWVVDPSDAELYEGTRWHAVYYRLRDSNTTDHAITGVLNYGLVDEQSHIPRSL